MRPDRSPSNGTSQPTNFPFFKERLQSVAIIVLAALAWSWIGHRAEQVRITTTSRAALLDSFDSLKREIHEFRIAKVRLGTEPANGEIQARLDEWPDRAGFLREFKGMVPEVVALETGVTLMLLPAARIERP